MSDRLNELRRQRALMQEHLAWLEAEISREAGGAGLLTPKPVPATTPTPRADSSAGAASSMVPSLTPAEPTDFEAEAILSQYSSPRGNIREDVRKGCLLYFGVALALVVAAVAGLWFAFRH